MAAPWLPTLNNLQHIQTTLQPIFSITYQDPGRRIAARPFREWEMENVKQTPFLFCIFDFSF